jgi:hypothetical protein
MPKFFVTSDIHSFYNELIESLNQAGFDKNNEDHWLIVCGDCFDRGPDSRRLLRYLKSLPRKMLIKGNHEQLLVECCKRGYAMSHDMHNGTAQTIFDLGSGQNFSEKCKSTLTKVRPFLKSMVNYFETKNHIFVHSWVPTTINKCHIRQLKPDWRNASQGEWDDAMWENPFDMVDDKLMPDKTIVFGHYHCSAGWARYKGGSEYGPNARFDPYYGDGFIAIDSCTAYSGIKSVIVIEDEFI